MLQVVATRRKLRGSGWVFLFVAALILFAAWNTGLNLLYVLVGGMVSFIVLSSFLSRWNLRKVTVKREAPPSVHRLEPFMVVIGMENHKRFMPAVSVRVESVETGQPTVGFAPVIAARRAAVLRIAQRCERRGIHTLPPLELVSPHPFGLGEVRRRYRDNSEVVVYPRVLPLNSPLRDFVSESGQIPAPIQDETNEYFSLREYVSGDDIRRIAWKASARLRKWLVREHQREISREIAIDFDTRAPGKSDSAEDIFEESVELVASLSVALMERHYYVSIVTPDGALPLGTGKGHVVRMLEFLARVEPSKSGSRVEAFGYHSESPGRVVLHVSANPEHWGTQGAGMRSRVLDPREVARA
ncbi:MAG: DUF58 domain-containing protein [Candidatus Hydrogenedentes bacterium]|nr:DUF58 domain-containing protein [Candidatus Hydrogenedentota bacterium]